MAYFTCLTPKNHLQLRFNRRAGLTTRLKSASSAENNWNAYERLLWFEIAFMVLNHECDSGLGTARLFFLDMGY